MGFYKDYLNKTHDEFGGKLSSYDEIAKEMEKVKENEINEINKAIDIRNEMRFENTLGRWGVNDLYLHKIQIEIAQLGIEKEELEEKGLVDYFKGLFEKEEKNLNGYSDNAFETMGACIQRQQKLSGNGIIATIYDIFGKKDEEMQKSSDLFDKANNEAACAAEAKNEWEELSNMEKATVPMRSNIASNRPDIKTPIK